MTKPKTTALTKVNTSKLSDSRLRLILVEMEKRSKKIEIGLQSTFNQEVKTLVGKHNVETHLQELYQTQKDLHVESSQIQRDFTRADQETSRISAAYVSQIRTKFDTDKAAILAKANAQIYLLKEKLSKDIETTQRKKDVVAAQKAADNIAKKGDTLNDQLKNLDAFTIHVANIQAGYTYTKRNLNMTGLKSPKILALVSFIKAISSSKDRMDFAKMELTSVMDDLRATAICSGNNTGVEGIIAALPTASRISKMSFKEIESSIAESSAYIGKLSEGQQ